MLWIEYRSRGKGVGRGGKGEGGSSMCKPLKVMNATNPEGRTPVDMMRGLPS